MEVDVVLEVAGEDVFEDVWLLFVAGTRRVRDIAPTREEVGGRLPRAVDTPGPAAPWALVDERVDFVAFS